MPIFQYSPSLSLSFALQATILQIFFEAGGRALSPPAAFLVRGVRHFGGSFLGLIGATGLSQSIVEFENAGTRMFTKTVLLTIAQEGLLNTRNFHLWIASADSKQELLK